jgi:hypothetical protein
MSWVLLAVDIMMKTGIPTICLLAVGVVLLAGCCGITIPIPNMSVNNTQNVTPPLTNATCSDKSCFIQAANNCENMNLTLTDNVGTFSYSSSKYCILTKTLVSLNANESQEMKNLLEGKNMTCMYEKGKFDQRWVTSLIYGIETCHGNLKDALGDLTLFS